MPLKTLKVGPIVYMPGLGFLMLATLLIELDSVVLWSNKTRQHEDQFLDIVS